MQGRFVLFVVAVVVSYTAAEMGAGGPVEHENSLTTEFSKDKLARVLSAYGSNEQVAKIVSLSMQVDSEAKYEVVFETASGKTCSASWFEIPSKSEVPQGTQLSCKSKRSVPATFDEYEMADNSLTTEFSKDKLARVLSAYGSNEQVAKIVSLSMQVDSEAKYDVVFETASGKTCSASWFEIPSKSDVPQGTQLSCKSKRSAPGSFEDVDEYEMADMVAYGESLANEGVNGYRKAVVKIVKAQKQVVYGTIYKINYILKTTACKMDDLPTGDCLGKEVAQRESCESSIYVSPYMIHGRYQHKVMSNECKAVVGGKFVTGHDQEDMEYAMHFAVSHVNMQINTMTYKGLYKVLSTDEKLSAGGKLYTFKFIVRDTDCMKNENLPLNSENCPIKTEKENHSADDVCSVTVWYSPPTKQVHVRSSACASASFF